MLEDERLLKKLKAYLLGVKSKLFCKPIASMICTNTIKSIAKFGFKVLSTLSHYA